MKNFFKKLSFVLAIAMVLTSIAPATASAAEISAKYVPAKKVNIKVNSEKVDTFEMNVGDTQTIKVGLPVTKAAKEAGFTKSTFKTYYSVEGTAVEVLREGNRTYNVTAVEAGEATITIGAAKNNKLAQAGEFKRVDTLTVTVNAPKVELSAEQTGANKITLTGEEFTNVVADYTVKRGNVTVSFKSATPSEDKTSVVLEAAGSILPKGEYTVAFKASEAVAFEVVDAEVAKIVVEPEIAIMSTSKSAVAYITIYNQFDEDVTAAQKDNVQVTGSDKAAYDLQDPHKITFTSDNAYTMNLSQVSLALVCKTNGVNVSKILTVVEQPKLASAEFVGVYKLNNTTGKYEKADLAEGVNLAPYRLVFKTLDQYGFPYANAEAIASLQVNPSSATGLTVATGAAFVAGELNDRNQYVAYEMGLNGFTSLGSGDVALLGVLLTNGKTVSANFSVAAGQKIDKITVSAPNGVYGGQENTLEFVALDKDGNEIKDYGTMSRMNNVRNMPLYAQNGVGLRFVPNPDGTAKLVYQTRPNTNPIATPDIITFLTETNSFTTANLSVMPNCVPKAIIGIDALETLGVTTGGTITLTDDDFIFQDQYGNVIKDNNAALTGVTVTAVVTTQNLGNVFTGSVTGASALTTGSDSIATLTGTTYGAVTVKVALDGVAGSDYTFNLYCVAVENVSSFAIAPITRVNVSGTTTQASVVPSVYGYYNGVKIGLTANQDYKVVAGQTVKQAAFGTTQDVKEETVTVVINNVAGTEVTKTYEYSNIPPYADKAGIALTYAGNVPAVSNAAITAADLYAASVISIVDQYSVRYPVAPRVTISNYADAVEINNNATDSLSFTFKTTGYRTIHVKYTWDNGLTFETDLVINVQ